MAKLSLHKGLKHFSLIAFASLFIYGCGSTPTQVTAPTEKTIELGNITLSASEYLAKAQQAGGSQKQAHQLNALRAALASNTSNDEALIAVLFSQLRGQTMLSDNHSMEWQLLQSLALQRGQQYQKALAILEPQSTWQVPAARWFGYYQHLASVQNYLQLNVQALQSLAQALRYIPKQQQSELSQQIWALISDLEHEQLTSLMTNDKQLAGWKSLALITKESMQSPTVLRQRVTQWAMENPHHMAVDDLPKNLVAAINIQAYAPQKIALLLPLSGRYSRLGQAVQHGIVSNLIAHNTKQELLSFDTMTLGVQAALDQALEQGAEFIIGPLLKQHVAELAALDSDIPTLFLNSSPTPLLENQYTFSLSKEAEALQGAEHIFNQGKKHPVIVSPNNAQGHKISRLFNEKWLELNQGDLTVKPVEAFYFDNDSMLKKTIEKLFETDKSQARINFMRLLVGNKMKSETRSRRDIDAIYLVANPKQTGMLMPSVEVTVSAFAPQVAVFVGSSGNASLDSKQDRSHLNQLTISEMPWFIQQPAQLPPRYIKKLWPDIKQSHMRLFAMGYDAYGLIARLAQMQYFPQFSLEGFSGTLSLNEENDIIRELAWAQYQRGKLIKR